MVNISQTQALALLAQAQTSLTLVAQALQQVIAGAQSTGAANVTLRADLLQAIAFQLQLAADAVERGRIQQQQQAMVRIRGDVDIRVRARQMQVANLLARTRVTLNAALQSVQQLLATAQATGGATSVSVIAAQQLLAQIQTALTAIVQAAAMQQQNILITPVQ
jgi:hypothetical protein